MAGMAEMDMRTYVARIGYQGALNPTAPVLAALHQAHMLSVPFENLDILLGHRIELSLASFYDKIVRRRRGGFCYELNGLFGWLLERLGFRVTLLSGRVYTGNRPGPEFDHMVLLLDMGQRMIADVGFGDSFLEPLPLGSDQHAQHGVSYRLTGSGDIRVLEWRRGDEWEPRYAFSLAPRRLQDFAAMCRYQQTSPDSVFTRKSVCSRATPEGRITLANGRLIVTAGEHREEREIASQEEYRALLRTRFGIALQEETDVDRLMVPIVR